MLQNNLFDEYRRIMTSEMILGHKEVAWGPMMMSAEEAYHTVWQIDQTLLLSFEKRSYNKKYHLSGYVRFFESVGGHTNLVRDLVGKHWRFLYGADELVNSDGYSYMEVEEAAGKHDSAEVVTHDIADDGKRDETAKLIAEQRYRKQYVEHSPKRDCDFEEKVSKILASMEEKDSETGRALYAADKSSALLVTLCCDKLKMYPYRTIQDEDSSERDREEMRIIRENDGDANPLRHYLASEMWAIDYFVSRRIVQYDDTGFFTALVVMYTLMVKGQWYTWREKDYENTFIKP